LNLEIKPLSYLFGFLLDENYLKEKSGKYELTEKGLLFTERHPESIKNACILWGKEHLSAWQNLDFSLKTGRPSFENIFGAAYFDYLESSPKELKNYHLAMRDYAKDDYKDLSSIINFSKYKTIADVGGGLGVVVNLIASNYPNSDCILFDLPSVISLVEKTDSFQVRSGSFFEPLPFKADAIILSRVLHDWNDEKALKIISNCKRALNRGGTIFIIEILQDKIKAQLLSLNMLVICESFERTFSEYQSLLQKQELAITDSIPLNSLQSILVCK